jgi:hypothetical protein
MAWRTCRAGLSDRARTTATWGLWHVTAIDLRPRGRYAKRETIEATGETETAALGALVALLARRVRPSA